KHAPSEGADSKHRKVTSRDVFGAQRLGGRVAFPAHALGPAASLKSRHLFKLRRCRFQPLVQREGVESPTVLRPTFDAAIVALPNAVEFAGIRNWKGAQHHRMNQCEYGCSPADPQCERQNSRSRKNRRTPEL